MPKNIKKSYEMTDAKISFVSLVGKAANKRQFLITKSDDGNASFATYGKIVKVDDATHYVTGIVYEPLVKDTDDNFMTAEEIQKAAYWFAKNGDKVDIQHSFEKAEGVTVVETYIAPVDMEIEGQSITKGTWLMTVEVENSEIWEAVKKSELTGFSMGGVGLFSTIDVPLEVTKSVDDSEEKISIMNKIAKFFGIEKGEVADRYTKNATNNNFWEAVYALQDTLRPYYFGSTGWVDDPEVIKEALDDFSMILTDLLTKDALTVAKAVKPIKKAGKKMSSANKEKLDGIVEDILEFKSAFDDAVEEDNEDEEEEIEVTKSEITSLIEQTVEKAVAKAIDTAPIAEGELVKEVTEGEPGSIEASVEKAVKAVLVKSGLIEEDASEEQVTKATLEETVAEAVEKAMGPLLKSRGLPSNLNDAGEVQKAETHFMANIL